MSSQEKERKNWVTKEIFIVLVPLVAAYLCAVIYEAGFASAFGIPEDIITISVTSIFLTTSLSLMVATIAFLWIGLYYKILPSAGSPIFQGLVTFILILALALAYQFGAADARRKTDFYVMVQPEECVVLKVYGSTLVCAPFNRVTREVAKVFLLYPLSQPLPGKLKLEKVGPLISK